MNTNINNIEATNTMTNKENNTMNTTIKANRGNSAGCKGKRVMCIETGEIFKSATEAAKANSTSIDMISAVCTGKCKSSKGKTFRYIDEHNATLSYPEVPVTEREITIQRKAIIRGKGKSCNGNTNAVLCISTGEVFTSATDAARNAGATQGHMSNACRGLKGSVKGKRYCYVKDINEHLDEVATSIRKANMYDEFMTKEEKRKELVSRIEYYDNMLEYNDKTIVKLLQEKQELQESREKAIRELMDFGF